MWSHSLRSKENLFLKTTGPGFSKGVVYSVVRLHLFTLIRWIAIYPMDSVTCPLADKALPGARFSTYLENKEARSDTVPVLILKFIVLLYLKFLFESWMKTEQRTR